MTLLHKLCLEHLAISSLLRHQAKASWKYGEPGDPTLVETVARARSLVVTGFGRSSSFLPRSCLPWSPFQRHMRLLDVAEIESNVRSEELDLEFVLDWPENGINHNVSISQLG